MTDTNDTWPPAITHTDSEDVDGLISEFMVGRKAADPLTRIALEQHLRHILNLSAFQVHAIVVGYYVRTGIISNVAPPAWVFKTCWTILLCFIGVPIALLLLDVYVATHGTKREMQLASVWFHAIPRIFLYSSTVGLLLVCVLAAVCYVMNRKALASKIDLNSWDVHE